jgi:hypothetical protein
VACLSLATHATIFRLILISSIAGKTPARSGGLTFANVGVGQPFSGLNVSEFAYRAIGISQEIPFPGKLGLAGEEAQREADSDRQNYRSIVLEKTSQLKDGVLRLVFRHEGHRD